MPLRVHLLPESPKTLPYWVCAELRLINPYTHPSISGRVNTTFGLEPELPNERIDVVVMQRLGFPGLSLNTAAELVKVIRKSGAKLVYDIDDDLLCTHPVQKIDESLKRYRPIVRFLAREADLIICSTPALADRFSSFDAPKVVWRNAVDERMIIGKGVASKPSKSLSNIVGYAGTPTHLPDLLSVTEEIRNALSAQNKQVFLDFFGVADETQLANLFGASLAGNPRAVKSYREFFDTMQKNSGWDLAIAPLHDNIFNRSKSDIKFLDYAVFGVPGVYSVSNAFETVRKNETGMVADQAEFGEVMADLLDSPALRKSISKAAYDYVRAERTLEKSVGDLINMVETVL